MRVQERLVSLGASTSLSRTTTRVGADWTNDDESWKLKLDVRGDITYTGSLQLRSGEKSDVQWNDLAMLD